jgi:hypothetical protein
MLDAGRTLWNVEFSRQMLEKYSQYTGSRKSVQWEPSCSMRTDGQTDMKNFFIVAPCIPISIQFTHQQMHYLLNLEKFKIYTRIHTVSLLHVSVYDHHQGACTEPG